MNANIQSAFNKTINTDPDQNNLVQGSIAYSSAIFEIATNVITPTRRSILLETGGGASTDQLNSMSTASLSDGAELIMRLATPGRSITLKHMAAVTAPQAPLFLTGEADYVLSDQAVAIEWQLAGGAWYQVSPFSVVDQELLVSTSVLFDTAGNVIKGTNIASTNGVVKNSTGNYTILFENAYQADDYRFSVDAVQGGVTTDGTCYAQRATGMDVAFYNIQTGNATDPTRGSVMICGQLA